MISMKLLPNIETCIFIYWDHTLQRDLVKPYVPWRIGPLTEAVTMAGNLDEFERNAWHTIKEKRSELDVRSALEIQLLAIHDREREYLPSEVLRRPLAGWEMDWFG